MRFSHQILSSQHKTCGFLLLPREHNVNILQFLRTLCSFNLLFALFPVPLPVSTARLSTYESSHTVHLYTVSCSLAIWFLLHVPSLIFNIWQFGPCSGFSVPPSWINQTSLLLLHLLPRSVLCRTMKHMCTVLFLNVGSEKNSVLCVFLKASFIYFQYFHIYTMFLIKLIVLTEYLQTAGKPGSKKATK